MLRVAGFQSKMCETPYPVFDLKQCYRGLYRLLKQRSSPHRLLVFVTLQSCYKTELCLISSFTKWILERWWKNIKLFSEMQFFMSETKSIQHRKHNRNYLEYYFTRFGFCSSPLFNSVKLDKFFYSRPMFWGALLIVDLLKHWYYISVLRLLRLWISV